MLYTSAGHPGLVPAQWQREAERLTMFNLKARQPAHGTRFDEALKGYQHVWRG